MFYLSWGILQNDSIQVKHLRNAPLTSQHLTKKNVQSILSDWQYPAREENFTIIAWEDFVSTNGQNASPQSASLHKLAVMKGVGGFCFHCHGAEHQQQAPINMPTPGANWIYPRLLKCIPLSHWIQRGWLWKPLLLRSPSWYLPWADSELWLT